MQRPERAQLAPTRQLDDGPGPSLMTFSSDPLLGRVGRQFAPPHQPHGGGSGNIARGRALQDSRKGSRPSLIPAVRKAPSTANTRPYEWLSFKDDEFGAGGHKKTRLSKTADNKQVL